MKFNYLKNSLGIFQVVILDWFEVRMLHGITRSHTLGMIVTEHLAEKIKSLICN